MNEKTPDQLAGDELLRELADGVLWLTINRADSSNAIPHYVRDQLVETLREAHADVAVRAIVLTGAGERHFCTGADLRVRPPARERPEGAPDQVVGDAIQMMRAGFQTLMETIQDCQKPVIVALNGTAAGGGAMLTLAADLVIAADSARIVDVFVRNALIPDGGATYLLPRLVGMHRAMELFLLGDDLSAADAERLGIVNKVVPASELAAATRDWATRLAARPTKVVGWTKRLLHAASEVPRDQLLDDEGMLIELNMRTFDGEEAMKARMEKRAPDYKGW